MHLKTEQSATLPYEVVKKKVENNHWYSDGIILGWSHTEREALARAQWAMTERVQTFASSCRVTDFKEKICLAETKERDACAYPYSSIHIGQKNYNNTKHLTTSTQIFHLKQWRKIKRCIKCFLGILL